MDKIYCSVCQRPMLEYSIENGWMCEVCREPSMPEKTHLRPQLLDSNGRPTTKVYGTQLDDSDLRIRALLVGEDLSNSGTNLVIVIGNDNDLGDKTPDFRAIWLSLEQIREFMREVEELVSGTQEETQRWAMKELCHLLTQKK